MRRRKQIRLKDYDYSECGAYFVTICTKGRMNTFGEIIEGKMVDNEFGRCVRLSWNELAVHYEDITLDEFVIMPNHIHGIIIINDDSVSTNHMTNTVGAIPELPLPRTRRERRSMLLPKIIGRFKMQCAKSINAIRGTRGTPVWQRNYYDHIIRTERSMNRIREYIHTNPERWQYDKENEQRDRVDDCDRWLKEEGRQSIQGGERA